MTTLKYLSKFFRTLEMSLFNSEINLDLNSSKKSVILANDGANREPTFSINDTKFYVPVVPLSTQES